VWRPAGRQRVQVAYGARANGSRQLLGFLRSRGESQAAWKGLLMDLYRRGLEGRNLKLIITDGCEGLAAALSMVYCLHTNCRLTSIKFSVRNFLPLAPPVFTPHHAHRLPGGRGRQNFFASTPFNA